MTNPRNRDRHAVERVIGARLGQGKYIGERGCRPVTVGQRRGAPALADLLQHRGVVDPALRGAKYGPCRDQRRDQDCRYANAETGEVETEFADRAIAKRRRVGRRGDVVITAAMLVIGDDQQCRGPIGLLRSV
jgi:hypothetical protein